MVAIALNNDGEEFMVFTPGVSASPSSSEQLRTPDSHDISNLNFALHSPPSIMARTKRSGLVSLACTECRKQHLKCDAHKPTCSRCVQQGYFCQYLPSRRGGRRKPRQDSDRQPLPSNDPDELNTTSPHDLASELMKEMQPGYQAPLALSVSRSEQPDTPDSNVPQRGTGPVPWSITTPRTGLSQENFQPTRDLWFHDDRFLRLFYENFHVAHPILVPSAVYHDRQYPDFLQFVVNFVGSHYVTSSPTQDYRDKVLAELTCHSDRSPCMVQAWLIYSIAIYARGEWQEAQDAFSHSVEIALEIGMNRREFAITGHPENSIEAESLRRTWWELYVTDIFIAAPSKSNTFLCSSMAPEVGLPCEDSVYTGTCEIPAPRKILDFKRRIFAPEETVFSSFSYRIEATTILCRALVLSRLRDYHRDHLQAVENALVSWVNHLPPRKLDIVDSYGNIDEMMFQAHVTIAYATMLLHLPRSDLQPVLSQTNEQFWPVAGRHMASTLNRPVQSIKATEASRRISDAISLCPNVLKHSPFVIPALALCGMIQLATSIKHTEECFDHHYNRVTLILGCLKSTKRIWGLADAAYNHLRISAADALSDSMERWSTEPLRKFFPADSTPSSAERMTTQPFRPTSAASEGQDLLFPPIVPAFVDPTCYNDSFFTTIPEFDIS
ncbi:putative C6 transcription factor [Penicillium brasilianum]|uniref:Putative C6 transcription factor n=1 Tax=Penicillium brasilianum TaxID=104259 RepID=A0A1S9S1I8_PENBI|nr:putative C6 transcription factor [Penicillium brasilianum]